ncbi:MAG: hypothetical protein Q9190_003772 [Brigantiaea leucoxantha]
MAPQVDHATYTIGWIAPMPNEIVPAVATLETCTGIPVSDEDDTIVYYGGKIAKHHVVMRILPRIGGVAVPDVATSMRRSFPNIRHILLVGVGGGVPYYGTNQQIVLGDIVVGTEVVDLNRGARVANGFSFSGHTFLPSRELADAMNRLRLIHNLEGRTQIPETLARLRKRIPQEGRSEYEDPSADADRLFNDDYPHNNPRWPCSWYCNMKRSTLRRHRGKHAARDKDSPRIHYGLVGSGDSLVISSDQRNELYQASGAICFEMEATSLIANHHCLVIRGICDYSDSHKKKDWQQYAAATAAAYAKELISSIPAVARNSSDYLETYARSSRSRSINAQARAFRKPTPGFSCQPQRRTASLSPNRGCTDPTLSDSSLSPRALSFNSEERDSYSPPSIAPQRSWGNDDNKEYQSCMTSPSMLGKNPNGNQSKRKGPTSLEIRNKSTHNGLSRYTTNPGPYRAGHNYGSRGRIGYIDIPNQLRSSLEDWLQSNSSPFLQIVHNPKDGMIRRLQDQCAYLVRDALDRKLPIVSYRCLPLSRKDFSYMLLILTLQLDFSQTDNLSLTLSNAASKPFNESSDHFHEFVRVLEKTCGDIFGVFFQFQKLRAESSDVSRFIGILRSHSKRFPGSKFLFVTEGIDGRLDPVLSDSEKCMVHSEHGRKPLNGMTFLPLPKSPRVDASEGKEGQCHPKPNPDAFGKGSGCYPLGITGSLLVPSTDTAQAGNINWRLVSSQFEQKLFILLMLFCVLAVWPYKEKVI